MYVGMAFWGKGRCWFCNGYVWNEGREIAVAGFGGPLLARRIVFCIRERLVLSEKVFRYFDVAFGVFLTSKGL